jgi:transposase
MAVRARIDWKYALSLELTDAGFDDSVLSEFRSRLLDGEAESLLFDHILDLFREMGLVKARGKQRTDSTHILSVVRGLNRLELVGETMRHALDVLSTVAPEWLQKHVRPEWVERYVRRLDDHRLPKGKETRRSEAETIGKDGYELLDTVIFGDAPCWLREVPAVQTLRRVWVQNYVREQDGSVRWRTSEEEGIPPAAKYINHPIDTDARYGRKSTTTSWVGYRVHLTETCEDGLPNIITDVQTAPAPVADGDATPIIHETLREKNLLPDTQFVDTGYLDAELLAQSKQNYGVDLFGPTRQDHRGKARAKQGFGVQDFEIDWEREKAICPEGHESVGWSPLVDNPAAVMSYASSSPPVIALPVRAVSYARSPTPSTRVGTLPYTRKSTTKLSWKPARGKRQPSSRNSTPSEPGLKARSRGR